MAAGVHIGGLGAGLQELAKAGAPVKAAQAAPSGGPRSFAAQLQSLQGLGGGPARSAGSHAGSSKQVASTSRTSAGTEAVEEPRARPANIPEAGERAEPVKAGVAPAHDAPAAVASGEGKIRVAAPVLCEPKTDAQALPVVEGAVSGASMPKGVAPKKAPATGEKADAGDSAGAKAANRIVADAAATPVAALQMPVAAVEMAKVAAGVPTASIGGAKALAGRGHEAKKAVPGHEWSLPSGSAKADAVAAAAAVAAGGPVAAGGAPIGVMPGAVGLAGAGGAGATSVAASGLAAGPVLAVQEVASAPGLGSAPGGGHRVGEEPGHGFREEMEPVGGGGLGEPRMLVSTPNVLEVGITGGAHGWLRVRAELERTGEVTASLVASSAASADALHRELGSMSAYLKSEAVGVSSLAVTAMEKSGATQGQGGLSAGAGTQGGGGGGGASRPGQESQGARHFAWGGSGEPASGFGAGEGGQAVPAALLGAGVGGWLNVRV